MRSRSPAGGGGVFRKQKKDPKETQKGRRREKFAGGELVRQARKKEQEHPGFRKKMEKGEKGRRGAKTGARVKLTKGGILKKGHVAQGIIGEEGGSARKERKHKEKGGGAQKKMGGGEPSSPKMPIYKDVGTEK